MEVLELAVEHITLAPLNAEEAAYWHALADEVCGCTYDALLDGPADDVGTDHLRL